MTIRTARPGEHSTHKFPTSIYWGKGYRDGMRHVVADSTIEAYLFMRDRRPDCDWENLWRHEAGEWINCKDLRGTP
jgi:hypothetical protein